VILRPDGEFTARKGRVIAESPEELWCIECHLNVTTSSLFGSEREFDKRPISRSFPKHDEFGFGDRHALSLEEQVA
jgi:hypothetical protein